MLPILAMAGEAPDDDDGDPLTLGMRKHALEQLPMAVQTIAAYWQSSGRALPRREPLRSVKVGRNEPCPCGSGKKFKKCCGSASPSTLH